MNQIPEHVQALLDEETARWSRAGYHVRYEPSFPVSTFTELPNWGDAPWGEDPAPRTKADWAETRRWLAEYTGEDPLYYPLLCDAYAANPHALPPVVVAFHSDGLYHVNDGNHRVSCAVERGLSHIPAILAEEIAQ